MDEIEWSRENRRLGAAERDHAVDDLIALVGGVDGILQAQAQSDARYFLDTLDMPAEGPRGDQVRAAMLKAYRWQYIVSGVSDPRFQKVLAGLITDAQMQRILDALAPLMHAAPARPERAELEMVA